MMLMEKDEKLPKKLIKEKVKANFGGVLNNWYKEKVVIMGGKNSIFCQMGLQTKSLLVLTQILNKK